MPRLGGSLQALLDCGHWQSTVLFTDNPANGLKYFVGVPARDLLQQHHIQPFPDCFPFLRQTRRNEQVVFDNQYGTRYTFSVLALLYPSWTTATTFTYTISTSAAFS
jgi:hypothetical protein